MLDLKAGRFKTFIKKLGYEESEIPRSSSFTLFTYFIPTNFENEKSGNDIFLDYYYFTDQKDLFTVHLSLWNQNNRGSFIAVFDDNTYIIDLRQKPDDSNPLAKRTIIKSFEYGVNTVGFDDEFLKIVSKQGVNSSYYFDFVISHQQKRKSTEVDKDLLLNLLTLRNDLVKGKNEEIIHLLLLRCMFVKYLEDRNVFTEGYMLNALEEQSPNKLLKVFREVRKINGDLFKNNEFSADDIKPIYLKKLSNFFGFYDYQSGQGRLFPYQFDKIPIQLISNIYESFLKEDTKKENGVYYTPSFLVNFILGQALREKTSQNGKATVLDPACGSGAFLVEAYKTLIQINKIEKNFEKKKKLLQSQLFGVDLDPKALQIAAFSLYLALLEGEDSNFIQEKIRTESPILPSLLGKTLIHANALTDNIEFTVNGLKSKMTFDCIVANPPWGSVSDDDDSENKKLRKAIGNKSQAGSMEMYQHVSDFQRSQAFIVRASQWSSKNTIISMVVNNSIFLNENAKDFRKDFLSEYRLSKFFELSGINSILFKKKKIGQIEGADLDIGANEPCCVIVFDKNKKDHDVVKYISPKLNKYTENLRLITYSSKETKEVHQNELIKEDLLWKIFVNGNWADYHIIKKRIVQNDKTLEIECRTGFQPKKGMKSLGKPIWRDLVKANNLQRFAITNSDLEKFNWNQDLHRRREENIFEGERILLPERTLTSDGYRFRAVRVDTDMVHTDDILCIKIKKSNQYLEDYKAYLAILNSKFLGYCFYHISTQWGKGTSKRSTLRNSDITSLPFPTFTLNDQNAKHLALLVDWVEKQKIKGVDTANKEEEINNLVYDLYNLTTYERAVINEFFDCNLYRKAALLSKKDIENYANRFISVYSSILNKESDLNYTYHISPNIGAVICFSFSEQTNNSNNKNVAPLDILNIVKEKQISSTYFTSVLSEEKVKIYKKENGSFFIIKTNQFKDWTERQAIDDANEEIESVFKFMKKRKG